MRMADHEGLLPEPVELVVKLYVALPARVGRCSQSLSAICVCARSGWSSMEGTRRPAAR